MDIRPYTPADFEAIQAWHAARDIRLLEDYVPKTGFIADDCACGFLSATDNHAAYVEFLCSDPEAHPIRTGQALVQVVGRLVACAKERGITFLTCYTRKTGVQALAMRFYSATARPDLLIYEGPIL